MKDRYDREEQFHSRERQEFRKQRRRAQETDRSKFKKSDQRKEKELLVAASADVLRGKITSITGEGVWVANGEDRYLCTLKGSLKKEKTRAKNLAIVGDHVRFDREGAISAIEERFSVLARTDVTGRKEQLIAANIDQVFVIVSIVHPPLKPALVDRYLIAARKGNLHPIVLVNKIDLLAEGEELYREFLAAYEPLGFPILSVSTKTGAGVEALRSLMRGKTSLFTGQSGVGKSSLLNTAFHLTLKTGDLAAKTSKGAHTTTTAELIPIEGGGFCVDTPGIRSFGVWNLKRDEVEEHFTDIAKLATGCRFGDCQHLCEPGCAVLQALKEGTLPLMRYESYSALLREALGGAENRSKEKEL